MHAAQGMLSLRNGHKTLSHPARITDHRSLHHRLKMWASIASSIAVRQTAGSMPVSPSIRILSNQHAACRKKRAVDTEDYDAAKSLKLDIDRLRAQAAASPSSQQDSEGPATARRKPPMPAAPTAADFDDRPVGRGSSSGGGIENSSPNMEAELDRRADAPLMSPGERAGDVLAATVQNSGPCTSQEMHTMERLCMLKGRLGMQARCNSAALCWHNSWPGLDYAVVLRQGLNGHVVRCIILQERVSGIQEGTHPRAGCHQRRCMMSDQR